MSGAEVKQRDSAHRAIKRYLEASKDATTLTNVELLKNYQQLLEEQGGYVLACGDENAIEEKARVQAEEWYLLCEC